MYKFHKEKNQHETSLTIKHSARSKFQEQKKTRNKFHEQNQFHEGKKPICEFHEGKNQHETIFTNKTSTQQVPWTKSLRNKLFEKFSFMRRKINLQVSRLEKSTCNKFQEQKSAHNKFNEQK